MFYSLSFQVETLRQEKLEIDLQLRSAARTNYQHSGIQTFEVPYQSYRDLVFKQNLL
jgi:hypothetical protein